MEIKVVHNSRDATLCKLQIKGDTSFADEWALCNHLYTCLMLQLGIMEVCSSSPPLSPFNHVTPEALKLQHPPLLLGLLLSQWYIAHAHG